MEKTKNSLLIWSGLITLTGLIVSLSLQFYLQPTNTRWYFFLTSVSTSLITYLTFKALLAKSIGSNFGSLISTMFAIKFFSYLVITIIFFILEKTNFQRLIFIAFLFLLYLLNTLLLIRVSTRHQKSA